MAVWHTGSLLWRNMLTGRSPDQLTLKLNNFMSKLIASCNADDAKMIFESLLSEEVNCIIVFLSMHKP